jgi:DNA ligase (NAD+)
MSKSPLELEKAIRHHNRLYYDLDAPELSDLEYDALVKELTALDPDSPVLQESGNPTYGEKVTHDEPMVSLEKCHTVQEIIDKFSGQTVAIMPKIDGLSMSLKYRNGYFLQAATRGNHLVGEDVTANAARIASIPLSIDDNSDIEIRGEAYIAKKDFFGIMDQPGYGGKEEGMQNPRNAAAGATRQKDPAITAERKVRFVAYRILDRDGEQDRRLRQLRDWGFEICSVRTIAVDSKSGPELQAIIDEIHDDVTLPYDIDGAVIMLRDVAEFEAAGLNGKYPEAALAYKYETEKASTTVTEKTWRATRTGRVIPHATFEATKICGTTCTHATLNNATWVTKMGVKVGDRILFEKANEIIPKILEVLKDCGGPMELPAECPCCHHGPLEWSVKSDGEQGTDLMCRNEDCPAKLVKLAHHVLVSLGSKGVAETTIDKLIDLELVKEPQDIFGITVESLVAAGFGERESELMVESVTGLKATPAQILKALGIKGWGESLFTKLFKNSSIEPKDWLTADFTDEMNADACKVGDTMGPRLKAGWDSRAALLAALLSNVEVDLPSSSGLANLSFCCTGTLSKKREEIQNDIREAGGTIKSSVGSSLDYLVAGEKAGSKIAKAEKAGVAVITEEALYEMIG